MTESKLQKYRRLWKLKGAAFTVGKIWSIVSKRIWRTTTATVFRYPAPTCRSVVPREDEIEMREIKESEYNLIDREILPEKWIYDARFEQGVRLFGALWKGRVVEYYWCAFGINFRDIRGKYDLNLKDDQAYFFDYRGIRNNRPFAFAGFRMMQAFSKFGPAKLEKETGRKIRYYSVVDNKNRNSMMFHKRYLKADDVATVRIHKLFKFIWTPKKYKRILRDLP